MTSQNTPFNPITEQEMNNFFQNNSIITTLTYQTTAIVVTRTKIHHYAYGPGVNAIGNELQTISPLDGYEFISASRRDTQTYFVLQRLNQGINTFAYCIFSINGEMIARANVNREVLQAQAVEGTAIIATSFAQQQQIGYASAQQRTIQFAFEMMVTGVGEGQLRPIRLARSHSDPADFIQTVFYAGVRLAGATPQLIAKKPVCTQQQLQQLQLDADIRGDTSVILLGTVHLSINRQQTIYRDYLFRARKTGAKIELTAEITKQIISSAPNPVDRIIPAACGAAFGSLLYNAFIVATDQGDLLAYQVGEQQYVQRVRSQNMSQKTLITVFSPSLICAAQNNSLTFFGVDGQYNDQSSLQKLYNQLANAVSPLIGGDEVSAQRAAAMQLLNQYEMQQIFNYSTSRPLTALAKIDIPFSVTAVQSDGRNILISGQNRILVFQLERLRGYFRMDYMKNRTCDFLTRFDQICNVMVGSALQCVYNQGIVSDQPIQEVLIDQQQQSVQEGSYRQSMYTTTTTTTKIQSRSGSPARIVNVPEQTEPDQLSQLRNSQYDLNTTQDLLEVGKLLADGQQKVSTQSQQNLGLTGADLGTTQNQVPQMSSYVQSQNVRAQSENPVQDEELILQNQLSQALQTAEEITSQLATRDQQLAESRRLVTQLFDVAVRRPQTLSQSQAALQVPHPEDVNQAKSLIDALVAVNQSQSTSTGLIGAIEKCLSRDSAFRVARACPYQASGVPSTMPADQQFYGKNQVYKLFEVGFTAEYLLPCGHIGQRQASKIVLDISIENNENSSKPLQEQIVQLFNDQYNVFNTNDEAVVCKQCRTRELVANCTDEYFNVNMPVNLLINTKYSLTQNLNFDISDKQHHYILKAVFNNAANKVFRVDENGNWSDADVGLHIEFSDLQKMFLDQQYYAIYSKSDSGDIVMSQETLLMIAEVAATNGVAQSNMDTTNGQLMREFSQLQKHDKDSQKVIQNQQQQINQLELELKEIRESFKDESIANMSVTDLIRCNQSQKQENEFLHRRVKEQEEELGKLSLENEQLQQHIDTRLTTATAEETVRRCLAMLGAQTIPRYGEELYRALENMCRAIETERQVLRRQSQMATSNPSLIRSQEIRSTYEGNRCYDCLLPGMAIIFGLVLVGLFAVVLMDGL